MMWLIDTNILLRLSDRGSAHHSVCIEALEMLKSRNDALYICTQNLIEYFVVATRPQQVNGLGKSVEQGLSDIHIFRSLFDWLPEVEGVDVIWELLVAKYQVIGKQAHDARLVALMILHGVSNLITLNTTHFQRYTEIRAISPYHILLENT